MGRANTIAVGLKRTEYTSKLLYLPSTWIYGLLIGRLFRDFSGQSFSLRFFNQSKLCESPSSSV